jgi:hypothetical protein
VRVSAEGLLWWVRNGPTPAPLVTTGDPARPTGGVLDDPSTRVLFGDPGFDYGVSPGARFTVSVFDRLGIFGAEASAFFLTERRSTFRAASSPTGDPRLVLPFFDVSTNVERGVIIANPGTIAGSVDVTSSTLLWGAELNGLFNVIPDGRGLPSLTLIAGLRYLNLDEDLQIRARSSFLTVSANFLGQDQFDTRNQFFGGQVGTRLGYRCGCLSAELTGLVAVGATDQETRISGFGTFSGVNAASPGTFPGFVFTQPTNLGTFRQQDFSIVPQLQAKFGLDLWKHTRATFGYDLLLWTNVARPGSQMDRSINLTQAAPDLGGTGVLSGPARPTPLSNPTNFWAHGFNFGLELHW